MRRIKIEIMVNAIFDKNVSIIPNMYIIRLLLYFEKHPHKHNMVKNAVVTIQHHVHYNGMLK